MARPVVSWAGVTARRMARHHLTVPSADGTPADVAAVLCGAHAQVPSAAEFSVGRRIGGATRSDVRRALTGERSLVKTFGPRGTIHLLPVRDLPMWTGALTALPPTAPAFAEHVRFSDDETDVVVSAIGDALADDELTVDELDEAVVARAGGWAGERTMPAFQTYWPRWRQLTATAAHRGVLCFGAGRGRNVTYTNPHRWLPGFRPQPGGQALRALVTRWLHAYGPATSDDLARWLAAPPARTSALFDELGDALEPVRLDDGREAWVPAGDVEVPDEPHRGVRLLPYFDAFVVACRPRDRLYPGRAAARALTPSGQAGNVPVVLVDGVVGGVWHQRRSGTRLDVTVEPIVDLGRDHRRELDDEVERLGTVLEARPSLRIGTVTVGPHA